MAEPVEAEGRLVGVEIHREDVSGLGFPVTSYVVQVRLDKMPGKPVLSLGRKLKLLFEDEEAKTGGGKDG